MCGTETEQLMVVVTTAVKPLQHLTETLQKYADVKIRASKNMSTDVGLCNTVTPSVLSTAGVIRDITEVSNQTA